MGRIKVVMLHNKKPIELTQYGFVPGRSKAMVLKYSSLENWKTRRIDKKTEAHWNRIAAERPLNSNEEYQREWNFIELDYNDTPSNNGYPYGSPAFAFTTDLVKYLRHKEALFIDGQIIWNTVKYLNV